jgi:hypothetical protein
MEKSMALFDQYAQPGVYTTLTTEDAGTSLFGDARITVLLGEGEEFKTSNNVELHRGSSSSSDDRKVLENLSDQVDGVKREFQVAYFPIVNGDGRGTTTNTPTDISVTVDGNPISVSTLDGATGKFLIDVILLPGSDLRTSYFFKRSDDLVTDEDLSVQIPKFATLVAQAGNLSLKLEKPGFAGNNVTVAFTETLGAPKSDTLAISGQGTDVISIELVKGTVAVPVHRTIAELATLINTGIITASGGLIQVTATLSGGSAAVAATSAPFVGGEGQSTSKVFKVKNLPIVDGSNGGVVTNLPAHVKVTVNGSAVGVTSVDGLNGLITLNGDVAFGSTLLTTYFTNTYQDTFDFLPAENITEILKCGFSPDRDDFINTIDYVLEGDKIQWGASVSASAGLQSSGFTAFDASHIIATLVDDKVYLELATGSVNGINNVFTLKDAPTTGSGLSRVTDNPAYVKAYTRATPTAALVPVTISSVDGANKRVTLFNPPATGSVYVTYFKSRLADNKFKVKVQVPGVTGQGSYSIWDKNDLQIPTVNQSTHTVADPVFTSSGGILWPNTFSDAKIVAGAEEEVVTLTFATTGESYLQTPGTQATNTTAQTGITFRTFNKFDSAVTPVSIQFKNTGNTLDAAALTIVGNDVSVEITDGAGTVRTLTQIVALFTANAALGAGALVTTAGGLITATLTGTGSTNATTSAKLNFAGGTPDVNTAFSSKYTVSSNLVTGGSAGIGYLGQTYNDSVTGFSVTIVDPNASNIADYGLTAPISYRYAPGDTLVFVVSKSVHYVTSTVPVVAIPGIRTKVSTTFGMAANDYLFINTYNKAGAEPTVGEFYYVSFKTAKTDKDYELKIFTNLSDVYAAYGNPTVENKLSLAARLAVLNGTTTLGCMQLKKQVGSAIASNQTFIDGIASLARPITGGTTKASVIVPLSTEKSIQQFLAKHLNTQAAPRNKGEAMGFVGFSTGTSPVDARSRAQSIKSERVVAVYPAGAIISLEVDGKSSEYAVGGEFLAAAMAGMKGNPAIDSATTLTRKKMVGFERLLQRYDDPTMDQIATDGVSVLIEDNGAFTVRHYLTTDMSNPITQEPTNTSISDEVRQKIRKELNQFIGRKNLGALVNDVTIVMNSVMKNFVQQEIIEAYKGLQVTRNESDPTVLDVTVAFKPVFSLLYINVTLKVTTKA